jgi:hypothetical protein
MLDALNGITLIVRAFACTAGQPMVKGPACRVVGELAVSASVDEVADRRRGYDPHFSRAAGERMEGSNHFSNGRPPGARQSNTRD